MVCPGMTCLSLCRNVKNSRAQPDSCSARGSSVSSVLLLIPIILLHYIKGFFACRLVHGNQTFAVFSSLHGMLAYGGNKIKQYPWEHTLYSSVRVPDLVFIYPFLVFFREQFLRGGLLLHLHRSQ